MRRILYGWWSDRIGAEDEWDWEWELVISVLTFIEKTLLGCKNNFITFSLLEPWRWPVFCLDPSSVFLPVIRQIIHSSIKYIVRNFDIWDFFLFLLRLPLFCSVTSNPIPITNKSKFLTYSDILWVSKSQRYYILWTSEELLRNIDVISRSFYSYKF